MNKYILMHQILNLTLQSSLTNFFLIFKFIDVICRVSDLDYDAILFIAFFPATFLLLASMSLFCLFCFIQTKK